MADTIMDGILRYGLQDARFPVSVSADGCRNCRTFVVPACSLKKRLVHNNLPCGEKKALKARMSSPP
jgi:hypothetical protein